MPVKYLETPITGAMHKAPKHMYGMTKDGYTVLSGAPTSIMIRLQGERRWRRLMAWQFSNAATCFVRVNGDNLILRQDLSQFLATAK